MRTLYSLFVVFFLGVGLANAQEMQDVLAEVMSYYAEDDGPALAVQLTTPDGSWAMATGLADGRRPAQPSDRFRIASMSKTMVAVATLQLVEDGVFSLDDMARDWLPVDVVRNITNLDAVTIRQLLNMRSGIEDYLGEEDFWYAVEDNPTYAWTALEVLQFAYDLPAVAAPDEEFYYSNTNYILLQLILEEAAAMPLHELLRESLFEPLNMDDTYTQISETLPGGFVSGYGDVEEDGRIEDVSDVNDGAGLGDGGLISTVGDLTTFYQALLQDQTILDDAMMDELLTFLPDPEGGAYSLGLSLTETELGDAWGHSGSVLGFLSTGFYLPDEDIIVIVLSASEDFDPELLAEDLLYAILE